LALIINIESTILINHGVNTIIIAFLKIDSIRLYYFEQVIIGIS